MRTRRLLSCAALLIAAALAPLPLVPRPHASAAEDGDTSGLPLVYEGEGLRVTVTDYDEETGSLSGTLLLGKTSMAFVAQFKTNRDGEEVFVGTAASQTGAVRLRIQEESETVANVKLDGKSYRVVRKANAATQGPAKKDPPEDRPGPQTDTPPPAPGPKTTERPPAPPEPAKPQGTIVMKLHTVRDPGTRNIESHSVLAPKGWKVEGNAWWPSTNFFKILPSQDIKVTAPDGRMVHLGPSIGATDFQPSRYAVTQLGSKRPQEGTASDGYPVIYMPESLEAWKPFLAEKGIRATYPKATNVRVDKVVVVPELTQIVQRNLAAIKRQNEEQNRQNAAMGLDSRSFSDGAVLAASCSYDLDGRSWELLVVFGATHHGLDAQVGRQLWWSLEPNMSFRAPAGQLEGSMPLLLSIAYSLRMTPEWAQMKHDHMVKMNQIAAKGARDRARILAEHNREINRIINDGYREREAIRDETHRKVINSIRGVEDYTSPGSGTSVQLPNNYGHVYTNGNGEYILTDDANYDPNTDPNVNNLEWKSMKPVGQ